MLSSVVGWVRSFEHLLGAFGNQVQAERSRRDESTDEATSWRVVSSQREVHCQQK